jgi:site-specific DNA recombinase
MPQTILANSIPAHHGARQTDPQQIAAIYARVSTTDQADKGYSLPTQIAACQALARQEGYTVPESHIFIDDYTGTSLNRPQLAPLRDLVRQQLVQAVFIHDLDRLSRKLAHQLLLSEEFEQSGVALRIVTMPAGATTPETQLLSNVRGIIAEYERAKTVERTARGRRGRAQAGHAPYGRVALGYRYVRNEGKGAHFEVDAEEAALVARIFRLYVEEGLAQHGICRLLTQERIPTPLERQKGPPRRLPGGVWHQSTVADILRNSAYVGTLYYGKKMNAPGRANPDKKTRHRPIPPEEWIAIPVPAIIDQQTFDAAQARRASGQQRSRRNRKHGYLFVSGRLRCGQCGRAMTGEATPDRQPRYRCGRKTYQDGAVGHTRRSVLAAEIEPVVWAAVERVLHNPALIATELERRRTGTATHQSAIDRDRQHYQRQLAQCDKDLTRWEAAYLDEVIDLTDFKAKKSAIDARRGGIEQELHHLDRQEQAVEQALQETVALRDYCARVRSRLQHVTLEEQHLALDALRITVTWHPERAPVIEGSIPVGTATSAVR